MELEMSSLPKTWILDLDGTIVKHNGHKIDGKDSLLPNARDLLSQIREEDCVVIVTSRELKYKEITEQFLQDNNIRYDHIIYEAPYGERILINDNKPSGLKMSYAIDLNRDNIKPIRIRENPDL